MIKCPTWTKNPLPSQNSSFHCACQTAYAQLKDDVHDNAYVFTEIIELWHYILFHQFVPLAYYAGYHRRDDPDRPCLGINVKVNGMPGSAFLQVRRDLTELFGRVRATIVEFELSWHIYSQTERAKRLSILLGYLVGQFVKIHPFINGNGHVSRMLWAWGLSRFNVSVQARICPRPDPPYSNLMKKSMEGDFMPLMIYILRHLLENPLAR